MPMPEAAVDEDGNPPLPELYVRFARQLLRTDGIAVATSKEPLAEENLRRCVSGMDGGHDAAALWGRKNVGHVLFKKRC